MKRAVVVFSGGQDSTTCLVQALQQYDEVHCVTFDYGQRHRAEIDVARELALKLGARAHKVLDVTLLNELAVSSLTRDSIPVPDYEPEADGIPNTFVPGRNILFLTLAAIYAYQVKAEAVITGVCETDFSGYPDCRDEFVKALNHAVSLGMAKDIRFETPLMWIDKAETWALADYYGKLMRLEHPAPQNVYLTICSSFSRNSPSRANAFCVLRSIQTNVISASATTCPSGSSVMTWLKMPLLPFNCCN